LAFWYAGDKNQFTMIAITPGFINQVVRCMNYLKFLNEIKAKHDLKVVKKSYIVLKCMEKTEQFPTTDSDVIEMVLQGIILIYRENKNAYRTQFSDAVKTISNGNETIMLMLGNLYKDVNDFLDGALADKIVNGSMLYMTKDAVFYQT
jgi:hypothetical protein